MQPKKEVVNTKVYYIKASRQRIDTQTILQDNNKNLAVKIDIIAYKYRCGTLLQSFGFSLHLYLLQINEKVFVADKKKKVPPLF